MLSLHPLYTSPSPSTQYGLKIALVVNNGSSVVRCLIVMHYGYIKKWISGMIVNETSIHQRSNEVDVSNIRQPYGLRQ